MEKLSKVLKDFIKCLVVGSLISFGVIIVIGIISFLISKFNFIHSLEVVKSVLLIIGPLGLILGALLILKKREEKELIFIEQWKKKYSILSYKVVLILVSLAIIFYGGIIDWIILIQK